MTKKPAKKAAKKNSPEQIKPEEALSRMTGFADRKEKFIAAIKKSKN